MPISSPIFCKAFVIREMATIDADVLLFSIEKYQYAESQSSLLIPASFRTMSRSLTLISSP